MKQVFIILRVITKIIQDPENAELTITLVSYEEVRRESTEQLALAYCMEQLEQVRIENAQEYTIIKTLVKYESK